MEMNLQASKNFNQRNLPTVKIYNCELGRTVEYSVDRNGPVRDVHTGELFRRCLFNRQAESTGVLSRSSEGQPAPEPQILWFSQLLESHDYGNCPPRPDFDTVLKFRSARLLAEVFADFLTAYGSQAFAKGPSLGAMIIAASEHDIILQTCQSEPVDPNEETQSLDVFLLISSEWLSRTIDSDDEQPKEIAKSEIQAPKIEEKKSAASRKSQKATTARDIRKKSGRPATEKNPERKKFIADPSYSRDSRTQRSSFGNVEFILTILEKISPGSSQSKIKSFERWAKILKYSTGRDISDFDAEAVAIRLELIDRDRLRLPANWADANEIEAAAKSIVPNKYSQV
jgi:hypothetical protein